MSEEPITQPKIVKPLGDQTLFLEKRLPTLLFIVVFALGIITGLLLTKNGSIINLASNSSTGNTANTMSGGIVVGSSDTKTFKDCAQGKLAKNDGKITDEGSHKLLREGGESQSVYLTSSVVDLDQFLGKNIQVCGETNKAQRAGWLMDVGRVKVL